MNTSRPVAEPARASWSCEAGDVRARRDAASDFLSATYALQRSGRNVLTELLTRERPQAWEHYPQPEVFDEQTGYRYYYHSHASPGGGAEHGHFHLFAQVDEPGEPAFTHLLCIAVSATGLPQRAFTTNRWVTGEHWRPAAQVMELLDGFQVRSPQRLDRVHRWLKALLGSFRPQLCELLRERDLRAAAALRTRPGLFEDRRTYVLSQRPLNLAREFAGLDRLALHC